MGFCGYARASNNSFGPKGTSQAIERSWYLRIGSLGFLIVCKKLGSDRLRNVIDANFSKHDLTVKQCPRSPKLKGNEEMPGNEIL